MVRSVRFVIEERVVVRGVVSDEEGIGEGERGKRGGIGAIAAGGGAKALSSWFGGSQISIES